MAEAVYVLCALTSLSCAILLLRGYLATRTSLLFWSSLCFAGLALNSALLLVDLVIVPEIDMSLARNIVALLAMGTLLFGLVWERP
jgi:hypothetical protein